MNKRLQTLLGVLVLVFAGYLAVAKDYSEIFLGMLLVVGGHLVSSSLLKDAIGAIASAIRSVLGAKKDSE